MHLLIVLNVVFKVAKNLGELLQRPFLVLVFRTSFSRLILSKIIWSIQRLPFADRVAGNVEFSDRN